MRKILTITLLTFLLSVSSFAQTFNSDELGTKYDKFKDTTTVTLTLQLSRKLVPGGTGIMEDLSLTLASSFDGKKPSSAPSSIMSFFLSISKKKQYSTSHSWIILADEERVKLGDGEYQGGGGNDSKAAEVIFHSISLENLRKITNAKKVEMQLGNTEFTLTESQVKTLKEFYRQITPQP